MALKKCHECGHQVSTSATACPSCGAKVKKGMGCGTMIAVAFLAFIGLGIIGSLISSSSSSPGPQVSTPVTANPVSPKKVFEDAKAKFDAAIADKYKELVAFKQAGDTQGVLRMLKQFETFKRMDYQDVVAIDKEVRTNDALARLKALVSTDFKALSLVYSELAALQPDNAEYPAKASKYAMLVKQAEEAKIAEEKAATLRKQKEKEALIKQSLASLTTSMDEVNSITWYRHKLSPESNASNALFTYIGQKEKSVWLRMKITYTADDWLFIKKYTFNVDGVNFPVSINWGDRNSDNSGGSIWEWVDFPVDAQAYGLLIGICESKRTILRYEGRQYYKDRDITSAEKQAIREVVAAYAALGGQMPR